jgi:heptosyltransferase-3
VRQSVLERLGPTASIVLIRLRSLGDTVLTTPAIHVLRAAVPQGKIHVVIEERFAGILEGHPDIDSLLAIKHNADPLEKLRLIRQIRALSPGLCWNLHGGSTSAWLTAFSGANFRAGYEHYANGWAYNVDIPRAQQVLHRDHADSIHTAEHHVAGAIFLGAPLPDDNGRGFPALSLAAEPTTRKEPYAVIHPTAATFTKQWAVEHFRTVADAIRDSHGLEPVFIAGPGEQSIFAELSDYECVGPVDLRELKSLLSGASLFVGNDSGPAHIAAAFQVPTAVIFGSSSSAIWHPWKTPHRVVETPWDCKPCAGDRCYAFDEPKCILSVEPEAVVRAIDELIEQ